MLAKFRAGPKLLNSPLCEFTFYLSWFSREMAKIYFSPPYAHVAIHVLFFQEQKNGVEKYNKMFHFKMLVVFPSIVLNNKLAYNNRKTVICPQTVFVPSKSHTNTCRFLT